MIALDEWAALKAHYPYLIVLQTVIDLAMPRLDLAGYEADLHAIETRVDAIPGISADEADRAVKTLWGMYQRRCILEA